MKKTDKTPQSEINTANRRMADYKEMFQMNFNEYKEKAFRADPKLHEEYKALTPEYAIVRQIIQARTEQNLTQKQLADRIGIRQSNISRLESGTYNPSLGFLKKVADGLGKELHIEFR